MWRWLSTARPLGRWWWLVQYLEQQGLGKSRVCLLRQVHIQSELTLNSKEVLCCVDRSVGQRRNDSVVLGFSEVKGTGIQCGSMVQGFSVMPPARGRGPPRFSCLRWTRSLSTLHPRGPVGGALQGQVRGESSASCIQQQS